MKAASSSDHSIHIMIFLLWFMGPERFPDSFVGFAFDGIPDLLFKVGLCVIVFVTGDHD
jgi:hypothetical protein